MLQFFYFRHNEQNFYRPFPGIFKKIYPDLPDLVCIIPKMEKLSRPKPGQDEDDLLQMAEEFRLKNWRKF